jgi:hypothetical protein
MKENIKLEKPAYPGQSIIRDGGRYIINHVSQDGKEATATIVEKIKQKPIKKEGDK